MLISTSGVKAVVTCQRLPPDDSEYWTRWGRDPVYQEFMVKASPAFQVGAQGAFGALYEAMLLEQGRQRRLWVFKKQLTEQRMKHAQDVTLHEVGEDALEA